MSILNKLKNVKATPAVAFVGLMAAAGAAQAMTATGTAGTATGTFTNLYDNLSSWATGSLGKTLALSSLLVGLGVGVIKQSVMAAVVGVSTALVASAGPTVIDGVSSAGLQILNSI